MSNNKKDDSSISTAKTNSSSINKDNSSKDEEEDVFQKPRTRGGIKHKIGNFQPGRATISVPLSSFNGISHNASFQSKLLFFNGGKPRPKFQHIPYAHEKVPEDSKKKIPFSKTEKKIEKKVEKKNIEKEKEKEKDNDNIECNININQILESKSKITKNDNKNSNNINTTNKNKNSINIEKKEKKETEKEKEKEKNSEGDDDIDFKVKLPKTNTIYIPSNQVPSISLDYQIPGFSKIQKEDKSKMKKTPNNNIINLKLKTLDDQWSFQKILLDYNILDFTMTYEMCQIISNAKDKENEFEKLLEYLLNSIKEKIQEYSDDPNFNRFMLIQNYIIFFMVLVLNLKKYPTLIRLIFKGKINFFGELRDNLNNMKTRKKIKLLCILTNIFLDEYKELFFSNEDNSLEQLFIDQQTEFSDICSETVTFYDDVTYKKMFETLLKFDISYTNFFSNNNKIKDEDKPSYKLCVSQSLIRVAFSKEKKRFYQEKVKFYEYDLLKRIIDKDMEETRDKFGDEYKTLFRKEDLCDDFIKYMFFIFGNSMLIDCFVMPLKNMLSKIGITDDLIEAKDPLPMKRDITKEEFNTLMGIIIDTLTNKIPDVLKILLKILYESVMKHFTIEKNNYSPLYTSLIFNFLISPRIQMLYSINPLNCVFVRSLNRILRNTCFNSKFAEGDSLYEFNETMETNYNKLQKLVKEKIISITINDDIKNSLKDLFTEKYLIYPRFLFYWDSQLLCATIEGGVEQIINFEQLNATSTPTTD